MGAPDLRFLYAGGSPLAPALKHEVEAFFGLRLHNGYGLTEASPTLTQTRPETPRDDCSVGPALPGVELRIADDDEVLARGASVTPGYWRQPELHDEAYDDEGFFRSGDAAAFIDPAAPQEGLRFDGRIAEDFKLVSGTWVSVNGVRARALADALPHVHDVVVTGDGRDRLGLLVFLAPAAARLAPELVSPTVAELSAHPAVRAWAQGWLDRLAAGGTGSSNRVDRVLLMDTPASAAQGELTDKGSLNQRAVLAARAGQVERLYAEPADPLVLRARR
jgi:feruloyl-CoA synthase